jgi:hypothetical protein
MLGAVLGGIALLRVGFWIRWTVGQMAPFTTALSGSNTIASLLARARIVRTSKSPDLRCRAMCAADPQRVEPPHHRVAGSDLRVLSDLEAALRCGFYLRVRRTGGDVPSIIILSGHVGAGT